MPCSVANVKKFKKSDHTHRGQDLDDRGSVFRPVSESFPNWTLEKQEVCVPPGSQEPALKLYLEDFRGRQSKTKTRA